MTSCEPVLKYTSELKLSVVEFQKYKSTLAALISHHFPFAELVGGNCSCHLEKPGLKRELC